MKGNLVRLVGLTVLLSALIGIFLPVQIMAITDIQPLAFYGDLKLSGGGDAPVGCVVTAKIDGVVCSNSLVTTLAGKYGGPHPGDACLIVQSNQPDGTPIEFFVNGQPAIPANPARAVFSRQSVKVELGLTFTPASGGGGGMPVPGGTTTTPAPSKIPLPVSVNGKTINLDISPQGNVLSSLNIESQDRQVVITITEGTRLSLPDGSVPTEITVSPETNMPPPSADTSIIGVPYKCEPSGLTFSPPIYMVFKYNPVDFPSGIDESELKIAFYNETTGKWEIVPCIVNTETNEITAIISHFTDYAVIAPKAPAATTPAAQTTIPAVTTTPAPTQPASTTPAAATTSPAPSVTIVTTTTSETVLSPVNWGLIGGIIGALVVVIVFLMILLLRRRTH